MDVGGDLSITLSPPCVLADGTYWVAQQVRQDFTTSGQHFWGNRQIQTGNASVWRNPANGFALGCTDWTPQTTCGVGGATNPDFLFELQDDVVTFTAVDGPGFTVGTPAVGPFGMLVTALALAGGAAYVRARRRQSGGREGE
jgi:hypothetical protein